MSIIRLLFILAISFASISKTPLQAKDSVSEEVACRIAEYSNNRYLWPAFHYALFEERPDVALVIAEIFPEQIYENVQHTYSAASNPLLREFWTSLMLALELNNEDVVEMLIEKDADANTLIKKRLNTSGMGTNYKTPLHSALKHNNYKIINLLLEHGAEFEVVQSSQGFDRAKLLLKPLITQSALNFAANNCTDEIFKTILEFLARKNKHADDSVELTADVVSLIQTYERNDLGWPGLHYAILNDDLETFSIIVRCGADLNHKHACPESAYALALAKDHSAYRDILLEHGVNKEQSLITAAALGKLEEVIHLFTFSDTPPSSNKSIDFLSVNAGVKSRNTEVVDYLLSKGFGEPANMELILSDPEMLAVFVKYPHLYKRHLFYGLTTSGFLDKAHLESARILLEAGLVEEDVMPSEVCAVKAGLDFLKLIHKYKRYPDNGEILHRAISDHNFETIEYLLLEEKYTHFYTHYEACINWGDQLDAFKLLHQLRPLDDAQIKKLLYYSIEYKAEKIASYLMSL